MFADDDILSVHPSFSKNGRKAVSLQLLHVDQYSSEKFFTFTEHFKALTFHHAKYASAIAESCRRPSGSRFMTSA